MFDMEEKDKEKIIEEWNHFCKCINFADSPLDARAIRFMNEFRIYLKGSIMKKPPIKKTKSENIEEIKKKFGFDPLTIGNRYRSHHIVNNVEEEDEDNIDLEVGFLCVQARDGNLNPIDNSACCYPNFVACPQDYYDSTYRSYYFKPLLEK